MKVSCATSSASWRLPVIAKLAAKTRSLCSCTIRSKRRSTPGITLLEHVCRRLVAIGDSPPAGALRATATSPQVGRPGNHHLPSVVIGASDGEPTNGWRAVYTRTARKSGRLRGHRSHIPAAGFSDGVRDYRLRG